jgi:iron complex transport system substrate-binding protein
MAAVPKSVAAIVALLLIGALERASYVQELPRRIISLVPATTEMLFAMGAGDRVAAVSNYDRFPGEVAGLPKVGGLLDPDVERVLS